MGRCPIGERARHARGKLSNCHFAKRINCEPDISSNGQIAEYVASAISDGHIRSLLLNALNGFIKLLCPFAGTASACRPKFPTCSKRPRLITSCAGAKEKFDTARNTFASAGAIEISKNYRVISSIFYHIYTYIVTVILNTII